MSGPTNAQLREQVLELEQERDEARGSLQQAQEELASAESGRAKAEAEVARLGLQVEDLRGQRSRAVVTLRGEKAELAEMVEEQAAALDRKDRELQAALEQVTTLHETLATIGRSSRFHDHPRDARSALELLRKRARPS